MRAIVNDMGIGNVWSGQSSVQADQFCKACAALRNASHEFTASHQIWTNPIIQQLTGMGQRGAARDLSVRVRRALGTHVEYVNAGGSLLRYSIGSTSADGSDVLDAAIAAFIHDGCAAAVDFGNRAFSDGLHRVSRGETAGDVWFCSTPSSVLLHIRNIVARTALTPDQFFAYAGVAFPNLWFHDSLRFGRFSKAFEVIKGDVIHHLGALNDGFRRLFVKHHGDGAKVCKEFSAEYGVDCSGESVKTRRNRDAMKQRVVTVGAESFTCEFHTKISPDVDRIHFHQGNASFQDNRVVIGIFADHLDT